MSCKGVSRVNNDHNAFQLWRNGQLNEAVQLLFREIELNKDNSGSYCNLASILTLAKKYEDAQAVLEVALEKFPNHIELVYAFGNLYYQRNMPRKAIEYFEQVFNINETNFKKDATVMLAQSYLLLNSPKKALIYLLIAHDNDKQDSLIINLLGDCMMQTRHFKEAKEYYMQVLEKSSENDEVLFKRGLVGAALKEERETVNAFFEKSKIINPKAHQERLCQLQDSEKYSSTLSAKMINNEAKERKDG